MTKRVVIPLQTRRGMIKRKVSTTKTVHGVGEKDVPVGHINNLN